MTNKIISSAISAVLALGVAGNSVAAGDNSDTMDMAVKGMEKCFGIAKAGRNDCGNTIHNCGGEAKKDGEKGEWVFVPTGACNKIVGGSTKA